MEKCGGFFPQNGSGTTGHSQGKIKKKEGL